MRTDVPVSSAAGPATSPKASRRFLVAAAAGLLGGRPDAALARVRQASPARQTPEGLPGRVILPADSAYDEARRTFNARVSRYPSAIVVCSTAAEVGQAVGWARGRGVEFRVRSGGHSYEGYSVADGALVIDLAGTASMTIDAAAGTATIGAGTRLGDIVQVLGAAGLALPAGTCPGVGFGGLALGGGVGYLGRPFGLTCDQVVSIEAVAADGRVVRTNDSEHPDLFWALRGGGGGVLAIAVSFTVRATAVDAVALCRVAWPLSDAAEVIQGWQRWASNVDRRLTVALALPGGGTGPVTATGLFVGPEAEAMSLLAPLLAVGSPWSVETWSTSYVDATLQLGGPPASAATFKNASAVVDQPLGAHAIEVFLDHLRAAPPGANLVGLFPFGGAVADIGPGATAFPHRSALFDLQYQTYWGPGEDGTAGMAWVRAIRDAMRPFAAGAYVNYIDGDLTDWEGAYYGQNLDRLRNVKRTWDPDDVFRGPQVVRPGD